MNTKTKMKFHKSCLDFPLLPEKELQALADDIRDNGQQVPIITLEGKIIDGRNRYIACGMAGVPPCFQEILNVRTNPKVMMNSLNVLRRHLTTGQRAMLAAEMVTSLEGRQKSTGGKQPVTTIATAADFYKVSRDSVKRAKKVKETSPKKITEAIKAGTVKLTRAERIAKPRKPSKADGSIIGIELDTSKPLGEFEPNADQLNKTWKVKAGDLWTIGDHRLLCGDSTQSADVKRALDGAKPWLMVTDPPYGGDYDPSWRNAALPKANRAEGKVTNDGRSQWASAYTRSGCEVAYVWHAGSFAATVAQDLTACGFTIRSQIIWAKKRFAIGRGDYHWAHEPCWYAVKKGATGRFYGSRKNTTLWADISDTFTGKDELYACIVDKATVYAFPAASTTVWSLANDKPCDGGHSTQKPLECMARPIRNHGMEGDTVFDPFAGTGTTGIAAHAANRKARMIEISPSYCAVILERFKQQAGIEGKRA